MLALIVTMTGAIACAGARTAATKGPPELYGYVFQIKTTAAGKPDTVPVAKARVWTDPSSNAIESDSLGYFQFKEGLIPTDYRVHAELGGVKGQTSKVPARLGESVRVVVLIGVEESAWAPAAMDKSGKLGGTVGPGGMHGVRPSP